MNFTSPPKTPEGARRLLVLADHLETVAPETFNISFWKCETAGCAVGHATNIPEFRALGFAVVTRGDGDTTPHFKGEWGFPAAETFFGIDMLTAGHLFGAGAYQDVTGARTLPTDVARRIRQYLAFSERRARSIRALGLELSVS